MNGQYLGARVAIVTGGSSGIGRATCLALAARGARVVVVGRTQSHVDETIDAIASLCGSPADRLGLKLDVRREEDMEEMAARTVERFSQIDILVASAGISPGTSKTLGRRVAMADLPAEAWDEIVDTNLKGVFLANRAVLPYMMRRGIGEIVNVSSSIITSGHWAFASPYCASKFGLMGLSETLVEETWEFGIRVQVMVPDVVDTPMLERSQLAAVRSISSEQSADLILEMLTSPRDSVLLNPTIGPFGSWQKAGRRGQPLRDAAPEVAG